MSLVLCQQRAYQKTLVTRVLSMQSDAKKTRLTLQDTILYPEGGGQPTDFGTIAGYSVCDVQRVHGSVLHTISQPGDQLQLAVGQEVEVHVDWARRYDHMQQHSAQHLITAIAHDQLGIPTTSFHLGQDLCAIELDTPSLSEAERFDLEERVNQAVRDAIPITHRTVDAPTYRTLPNVRSRGLPDGFTGVIRLVEIQGLDLNTCGGTHLRSTSELTTVLLTHTERARRQTRLYFLAGDRVRNAFHASLARERALVKLLSCAPQNLADAVSKTQESLKTATQTQRRTQRALNQSIAQAITADPKPVVCQYIPDTTAGALSDIATQILQHPSKHTALLTTAPHPQGPGLFLLAGPPDLVHRAGPQIAEALSGRGGGRKGRYQGRAERIQDLTKAAEILGALSQSDDAV